MVQWLRIHASNAGDPGSISDQGSNIPHAMGQLRPRHQLQNPRATTREVHVPQRRLSQRHTMKKSQKKKKDAGIYTHVFSFMKCIFISDI